MRSPEELCECPKIQEIVLKDLQRIANRRSSLPRNAVINKVHKSMNVSLFKTMKINIISTFCFQKLMKQFEISSITPTS